MDDDNKWALAHEYRRESVRGNVPAILCPDCEAEFVITSNLDGWPALRCLSCVAVHDIGLDVYDAMVDNLREARGLQ